MLPITRSQHLAHTVSAPPPTPTIHHPRCVCDKIRNIRNNLIKLQTEQARIVIAFNEAQLPFRIYTG